MMTSLSPWPTVSSHKLSTWPEPTNTKDNILDSFDSLDGKPWGDSLLSSLCEDSDQPTNTSTDQPPSSWELSLQLATKLLTIPEDSSTSNMVPVTTSTPRDIIDVMDGGEQDSGDDREKHDSGISSDRGSQRNPRFKTEWCRNFKEKGKCLYGDLCQFAHGSQEMRQVSQQNNYKTRKCNKYWIAGYCPYGPRCNYLHDETPGPDQVLAKPTTQHTAHQQELVNMRRLSQSQPTRRGSAGDSTTSSGSRESTPPPQQGSSGNGKSRLPSVPPPLHQLHRPKYGSGRLAAFIHNDSYIWVDTWTQTYA